ncbi:MAG: NAD(+)--dinitrogen-reductase ADP-D-ribosyltransferase [Candidatus Thiodiazotropha sp.]
MDEHIQTLQKAASLPSYARLSINRCNLPSVILGSLTYQYHPVSLEIDGVKQLHRELFSTLVDIDNAQTRADNFHDYMRSGFLLDHLDEAGFSRNSRCIKRDKADYLRVLRGWMFDADSKEAAVLKSWVESRFGLRPRNHHGPLGDESSEQYQRYQYDRARGLYNTNALEAQLDLLYTYCQYEAARRFPDQVILFRGTNQVREYEVLDRPEKRRYIMILNNLNSFSCDRTRADEFGDYILEVRVPIAKLLYFPDLLPGTLKGESEYLVIGGVYDVSVSTL